MGYYADLINEKKEKQNKVVKRGTFKSGNWWISQETAWPNRIVYSAHAEYTSGPYKGEHHGTDSFDSLAKAESYVKRLNSKEEKDNADSAYIEASQKAERIINRMLQSRDKKEAKRFLEKIGWETRTLGEDPADYARAIRKAVRNYPEKSAEILSNEKEEKDNENFHYLGKTFSVTSGNYKEVRKQIEQTYKDAVSKLERKISSSTGSEKSKLEEELRKIKSGYKETLEEFDWGFGNEKEEEKGYYAKLVEEKNANPYYIALSLIKDKHSVNDMVRELTSNYGVSKSEALHAIEKAAKDSHEAEIEKKARELY